ncbi:hypothetical protein V500_00498 [Pseudogymnoascus sp. VKM F-4518 (FW-2643)]|nr:hypothetical protein V500_00498 [Pseudogymnoascus sp. VKM F-4518 (FW-2643)]
MDLNTDPSSSSNTHSFLSSTRTWLPRESEKHAAEDKIGPLGLNTLSVPPPGPATVDFSYTALGGGVTKDMDEVRRPVIVLAPIVLVGHSMGGLVIKGAYLLVTTKKEYASIASRIQGILFLATPHRGSDCAQVLSKLLSVMGGQRPYVTDLNRDSAALHSINDEFPACCQDLLLYSFYETIPMSFAVKKSLTVERDLATMGYANERRAYLHADHRGVCKYTSRDDPNYLTVRNAIASVIAILQDRFTSSKIVQVSKERRKLNILLGVSDAPEEDFMSADSQRMDGSVEWMLFMDMNGLYARILDIMSKAIYGKELAKAILTWTVCSIRPLKVPELHEALQLDLKVSIDGLENSIRSCCGQLVYIDTNGHVQMTHLTARQFLLDAGKDSEFSINQEEGHRRLLLTGLQFLNSDPIKGPRNRRSNVSTICREDSAFINYASNSLCEHISHASSTDREVLLTLAAFFKSRSVLVWIEYIAKYSDQQRLVEAGKALGTFLQEIPAQVSSTSADVALLSSIPDPFIISSRHSTLPRLLCGSSSDHQLEVRGLRAETWDDCLATVVDMLEKYSSIACSKTQFSVGCFSGKIFIFKQTTCQKIATLQHGEPVRILLFGEVKNVLVSTGSKYTCIWDLESKTKLHVFEAPQQCMALSLDDEDRLLLGALKDHRLNFWDPDAGGPPEAVEWTRGLEAMTIQVHRRPTAAAFGIDCGLLAVIYKGQDILLWNLYADSFQALYSRESGKIAESLGRPYGSSGVRCLVFGNASNAHLLACAYMDGELVFFNTSIGEVTGRIVAFAHVLACSADGRMLATADPAGTIQLFNLETLQLIYRIGSVEPGLQDLTFSPDGLRLLDIRGSRCRLWDLADLVTAATQEECGRATDDPNTTRGIASDPSESTILITSIACDDIGEPFFVGKEDGSVHAYAIGSGLHTGELFHHARGSDMLWSISPDDNTILATADYKDREPCRWTNHPHDRDQLIVITHLEAHIYDWKTLQSLTGETGIELRGNILPELSIQLVTPCFNGTALATMFSKPNQPHSKSKLILWNTLDFTPESSSAVPITSYYTLSNNVEVLIGNTYAISRQLQRLIFLGVGQRVCAVDMETAKTNSFVRHFFFRADWLTTRKDLDSTMKVTKNGDLLLIKDDEVAVVRRGLLTPEFVEGDGNAGSSAQSTRVSALTRRTSLESNLVQASFNPQGWGRFQGTCRAVAEKTWRYKLGWRGQGVGCSGNVTTVEGMGRWA